MMTKEEFLKKVRTDLDQLLKKEDKRMLSLSTHDGVEEHHSIGQWLRNNWHLWTGENEWTEFFNANDIWHADDMSGIIIASYVRMLRNQEIKLDEQFKHYIDYWKKMKIDIKKDTLDGRAKWKAEQAAKVAG
jgi:hypothetical protein